MTRKKRYSKLEVEVIATVSGDVSLKDIHLIEDPNNTWLKYIEPKTDKPKKKQKKGRKKQQRGTLSNESSTALPKRKRLYSNLWFCFCR